MPFDFTNEWTALDNTTGLVDKVASYRIWWDPQWTWVSSETLVDLKTANDTQEFIEDGYTFEGQIVNNSGKTMDKVVIIVILRDSTTGELVATGYDSILDDLESGGKVDYYIRIELEPDSGYDGTNLDIEYIVQGEE